MKNIIILFIITFIGVSCNSYYNLYSPVKMNYSISIKDYNTLLCRDYSIKNDTLFLFDVGSKSSLYQKHVHDEKLFGRDMMNIMVVTLKDKDKGDRHPYPKSEKSVIMNYNVNIKDHGSIVCRHYLFVSDTLFLYDAGYYKDLTLQYYVADLKFIGKDWNFEIIDLNQ